MFNNWNSKAMSLETRDFVRDLVSYSALIVFALLVFGAVWYLRAKFRKFLQLHPEETIMSLSAEAQQRLEQLRMNQGRRPPLASRGSGNRQRPRRATITGEQISPSRHEFPFFNQNDPPPSYSSVVFPEVFTSIRKESAVERPPSYRSVFVVKPATEIDLV